MILSYITAEVQYLQTRINSHMKDWSNAVKSLSYHGGSYFGMRFLQFIHFYL